jgi:hypothetical protein
MRIIHVIALSAAVLALAASCASSPKKGTEAPVADAAAASASAAAPVEQSAAPDQQAPISSLVVDLGPYQSASAACRAALERADALASEGKWKSAIAAIDAFDKDSADPFALALKTKLLLAGAVGNDSDRSFAVVDLEPGQDLDSLRQSGEEYELAAFDPAALAAAQSAKGIAAPAILSLTLGDYYYDVLSNFQDQWELSPFEIAEKAAEEYKASFAGGLFVIASLRNQGEVLSGLERFEEAQPVYAKILELAPEDPLSHYGYALVLQKLEKPAEMLEQLDLAIKLLGDSQDRLGIVAMAAKAAAEMGDPARAEAYLAKTDAELAGTSLAYMLRHFVAVSIGDKEAAAAAAGKIVDEYGQDNATVRDAIVIWYQAGAGADALAFIDARVAAGGESLTIANLEFYKAVLMLQSDMSDEDRAAAAAALDDAEKRMTEGLPAGDPLFESIAGVREALTPPPPEAAADEEPAEDAAPTGDAAPAAAQ